MFMVRNPFQWLVFSNFGHPHPEIQDGCHFTYNILKSWLPANKGNLGNFYSQKTCKRDFNQYEAVSSNIFSKIWRFPIEAIIQNGCKNVLKQAK